MQSGKKGGSSWAINGCPVIRSCSTAAFIPAVQLLDSISTNLAQPRKTNKEKAQPSIKRKKDHPHLKPGGNRQHHSTQMVTEQMSLRLDLTYCQFVQKFLNINSRATSVTLEEECLGVLILNCWAFLLKTFVSRP